jgi:hypothetical protein
MRKNDVEGERKSGTKKLKNEKVSFDTASSILLFQKNK